MPNKYIKLPTDEERKFWNGNPRWYQGLHQIPWYLRIDLEQIIDDKAAGDEVIDLLYKLIDYARVRDRVIEHRHATVSQAQVLLNVIMRDQAFYQSRWAAQVQFVQDYLNQMFVSSATEQPIPPDRPLSDKQNIPGEEPLFPPKKRVEED